MSHSPTATEPFPSRTGAIIQTPSASRIPKSNDDSTPPTPAATKTPEPPFWTAHQRSISNVSYSSVHQKYRRPGISLEDNTETDAEENNVVWAKCVIIEDYAVIGGRSFGEWGPGTYVAWNCKVETLEGGVIKIIKRYGSMGCYCRRWEELIKLGRYSDFDALRERLLMTFPLSEGSMPPLPPKSVICK